MIRLNTFNEEEAKGVFAALPTKTRTYTPIANEKVIGLIHENAIKNNLTILDSKFRVNSDGTISTGWFDMKSDDAEMGIRASFTNSYDKTKAFRFAMGGLVYICSNGCFSSEVSIRKIHRGDAEQEAAQKIISGFEEVQEYFYALTVARDKFKQEEMSVKYNSSLIGQMYMEHDFITNLQLNIVKKQCEFSKNFTTVNEPGYSAWDLYNHVTESLKQSHPADYLQNHMDFHNFMVKSILE